jgi:CRP/FNR family transcriptional regulator, transcriptional activator FtrB
MVTLKPSASRNRHGAGPGPADFKSIRLFTDVSEPHLRELTQTAWQERLPARAVVIEQDADCEAFYALLEGTVEVLSCLDDQETVIEVVGPGSVLLLACVVTAIPYIASVRCLSPARILAVPASTVRDLFDGDKAFARSVATELSRSSCRMILDLKSLKVRTSIERLADWIIDAAHQANDNDEFRLPFGKRTLASRLGMTPECLSRSLRALSAHGVRVRGREVILADRVALVAFAAPGGGDDEEHRVARPHSQTHKPRKPQVTAAS